MIEEDMSEEKIFEQFKNSNQYSSLSKIFNQIVYNQKIGAAKLNSCYIYCNIMIPEYCIRTQKKVFEYDTTFRVNNPNIFQGTLMFYSKNQYLGCYNDINNILYLIDLINNDFNIFDEVIHTIEEIKDKKIRSIEHGIRVELKSKMMHGDKIYDLRIKDTELSLLDKFLNRTPTGCLRSTDGTVYRIELSNEQNIGLDSYKRELAEKAQRIVGSYRQKYYEDTENFMREHQEIINSNIPIPQFTPEQVVKSGLMIATRRGIVFYMFRVDINVHSVIHESQGKYIKLQKPISFNGGLLIIKATPIGEIIGVQFKHHKRHFHTDREGDVCLGSAASNISNTRIHSFDDILKLKNSIVSMMSMCNTHSMSGSAYRADEMKHLIESAKPGSLKNLVLDSGLSEYDIFCRRDE